MVPSQLLRDKLQSEFMLGLCFHYYFWIVYGSTMTKLLLLNFAESMTKIQYLVAQIHQTSIADGCLTFVFSVPCCGRAVHNVKTGVRATLKVVSQSVLLCGMCQIFPILGHSFQHDYAIMPCHSTSRLHKASSGTARQLEQIPISHTHTNTNTHHTYTPHTHTDSLPD